MDRDYVQPRRIGRRDTDQVLWDQLCRYQRLYRVGQIIASEMAPGRLYRVIGEQTEHVMEAERSLLFLHDLREDRLWLAGDAGTPQDQTPIPPDAGVAGWVYQNQTPLMVNDAYSDSRFNPDVDQVAGLITRSILAIPLMNREGRCIGVLEAVNKKAGDFVEEDKTTLLAMSHYIAIAVENSQRCRESGSGADDTVQPTGDLRRSLDASVAELTRLLSDISEKVDAAGVEGLASTLSLARRQVDRLSDLRDRISNPAQSGSRK